jgi:glutamate N-acetyltransferase / amino-acid N-acetyltransferase
MEWIKSGGVTSAKGYRAAGVACGVKKNGKKDLALVVSEKEARVGAAFTLNQVKAAPVKLSMQHAKRARVRAVVINSGNANCCTGLRGIRDARTMAEKTALRVGCRTEQVLVCSTGRIGRPLPIHKVVKGVEKAAKKLNANSGDAAARAMLTSDTFTKECAVRIEIGGVKTTIGGMAKGAGMIHPNMATMLAIITTDAVIEGKLLQVLTTQAVDQTFNRISVDGDTSTNDTVLVLANGTAGNSPLNARHAGLTVFAEALREVMRRLARMIVEDGECITHVVDLQVRGAASDADARRVAESIARSPLVKSSWAGNDPNWGRLMDVIGYSGARVREELVDIYYDGINAVKGGVWGGAPYSRVKKAVSQRHYTIHIDLHLGKGSYHLFVNDLTEGYVRFNMGD